MSEHLPLPEELDPEAFRIVDDVIGRFSEVFDRGKVERPSAWLGTIRIHVSLCTYNLLKSIRHLLSLGYWEESNILLRTMFELLLRLEDVERGESERKAECFVRYAFASYLVHWYNDLVYRRETGRATTPELMDRIEEYLQTSLGEFVRERRPGEQYLKTRRGKTLYDLVKESARDRPMRESQYRTLYMKWCEYVHGSPPAVLRDLQTLTGNISTEQFLFRERSEWRMVITLAVTLALDILFTAKDALPVGDLTWASKATETLKRMLQDIE